MARQGWRRLGWGSLLGGAVGLLAIALDCFVARHHPAHYHLTHWHVRPAAARWSALSVGALVIGLCVLKLQDRLLFWMYAAIVAGAVGNLGGYAVLGGVPDYITLGHYGSHYLIWNHSDFLAIAGGLLGFAGLFREVRAGRRRKAQPAAEPSGA